MSDRDTCELVLGQLEMLTASIASLHREISELRKQMPDPEWCPLCTHPLYDERKEMMWGCSQGHNWAYHPREHDER